MVGVPPPPGAPAGRPERPVAPHHGPRRRHAPHPGAAFPADRRKASGAMGRRVRGAGGGCDRGYGGFLPHDRGGAEEPYGNQWRLQFQTNLGGSGLKRVRKAVIPAAGFGTRFLPATKAQPKEMLPIVDKPVIQYIVEEAVASGIEQIVIITGQSKRSIEDHFDYPFELAHRLRSQRKEEELREVERISELANFVYVRQQQPLGNGHAVLVAKDVIGDEPFAVLWGDDLVDAEVPCLRQFIRVYERYGASVMGVMKVPMESISKYGVIAAKPVGERAHEVLDLVEKPSQESAPSDLAAVHGFVLTPQIFD